VEGVVADLAVETFVVAAKIEDVVVRTGVVAMMEERLYLHGDCLQLSYLEVAGDNFRHCLHS
jgi:hypothetical protein